MLQAILRDLQANFQDQSNLQLLLLPDSCREYLLQTFKIDLPVDFLDGVVSWVFAGVTATMVFTD